MIRIYKNIARYLLLISAVCSYCQVLREIAELDPSLWVISLFMLVAILGVLWLAYVLDAINWKA